MSAACKTVSCCTRNDFSYVASAATDAEASTKGPSNPNCPNGYVWGGLGCVRAVSPQVCSTGHYWDGAACRLGASGACAAGFFVSGGLCVACTVPPCPTATLLTNQITLSFNVAAGLNYKVYRSLDGVNYTLKTSAVGGAGVESYVDAVTGGKTYFYFISVEQNADCGYVDGEVLSLVAI